jgi:hypothetical protein
MVPLPDFHAWAADEAATLVSRALSARYGDALRGITAARAALDEAARSSEATVAGPMALAVDVSAFVAALTAHTGTDVLRARLDECEGEHQRLVLALAEARESLNVLGAETHTERGRADAAQVEAAQVTAEFEEVLDGLRLEHATTVRDQALASTSLPLDGLLTVFNALAKATTLTDVLTTLVGGIAREFSRVVLFDVHGNRLEGVQQVGFDFDTDISKVAVPLSVDSLLTRAVRSGQIESFFSGPHSEASGSIPFGGTPSCALALPVVVHGATAAIIYADDSDTIEFAPVAPQARAKFAELLLQHALLALVRVGIEQRALADVREYVARLVHEVEYAYTFDADAGSSRLECQQRLREALECTRQIYAQRVSRPSHVAGFLEERLAAVVAERRDTPFGRDLALALRPVDPTKAAHHEVAKVDESHEGSLTREA